MITEDKQLLLADLCGRLPYGVIVSPIDCGKAKLIGFKTDHPILFDLVSQKEYDKPWEIEYIKPYLRPLSSMTEEEYNSIKPIIADHRITFHAGGGFTLDKFKTFTPELIDWLNKKMFDFRGLIPKGLANVAPENMYKI